MSEPITHTQRESTLIASGTVAAVYQLLIDAHLNLGTAKGAQGDMVGMDAAPMVTGALGGIVAFCMEGGATDAEIRTMLIEMLDDVIPQVRFQHTAAKMGSTEGGHA
jgi:hypothetical protein